MQFHLDAALERIERIDPSTLTPEQTATRAPLLSSNLGTVQSTATHAFATPAVNLAASTPGAAKAKVTKKGKAAAEATVSLPLPRVALSPQAAHGPAEHPIFCLWAASQ